MRTHYLLRFPGLFLSLFLFISTVALSQQTTRAQFLLDDLPIEDDGTCFNENYDFDGLTILLESNQEIRSSNVLVSLDDNEKLYTLTNYEDFDGAYLYEKLEKHFAFQRSSNLFIDITTTHESGEISITTISLCLTSSEIEETGKSRGNPTSGNNKFATVPVFYVTDRKDTRDSDVYERFGGELAGDFKLNYGICNVSIPVIHETGKIESPAMWKLEFSEDPEKHIVLQKIQGLSGSAFYKKLSAKIALSQKRKTFMFIHGYNVSFADAAKRTAQMKYDLDFNGEAVLYSWPSQGATTAYTIDENNIRWATANIKNFLEDYITKSGAEEIYLVAHSMGNRGLTDALIDLANEKPALMSKITEIILAAPDIDAAVFKRDIAPQMVSKIKRPITLYVSGDDVALEASKALHGRPRAGDAEYGVMLVNGIETIDATGVDSSFLSHSYFAETKSILDDLIDVLRSNIRATLRTALKKVTTPNGVYWKFK